MVGIAFVISFLVFSLTNFASKCKLQILKFLVTLKYLEKPVTKLLSENALSHVSTTFSSLGHEKKCNLEFFSTQFELLQNLTQHVHFGIVKNEITLHKKKDLISHAQIRPYMTLA